MLLLSFSAWARSLNFHLLSADDAGVELVIETARIKRCPPELLAKHDEKAIVGCKPADEGHLIVLRDGRNVRLELRGAQGLRWQRVLEGTVVFQEGLLVVLEVGTVHRVIWLSAVDGSTTRTMDFVEAHAVPFTQCEDQRLKTFKSAERTAAICRTLD